MKIILGIDPGSNHMGYAVLKIEGKKYYLMVAGVLSLNKYDDYYKRLENIFSTVDRLISQYNPNVLAIESPFYGKNISSMLKLGRAQGAAIVAALRLGVPVYEYAPKRIKQSVTGRGGASKEQVQAMLRQMNLLGDDPVQFDASDALAVALCHAFSQSSLMDKKKSISAKSKTKRPTWKTFISQNSDRVNR